MGTTTTTNEAATFELISKLSSASSTTAVTFTSIPQTYTDLFLVFSGKLTSGTGNYAFRFNGSTNSSEYHTQHFSGAGSAISGAKVTGSVNYLKLTDYGYLSTNNTIYYAHIFNYSDTNRFKNVLSRGGTSADINIGIGDSYASWRNNSAITSIDVLVGGGAPGVFVTGYTVSLYGIKGA